MSVHAIEYFHRFPVASCSNKKAPVEGLLDVFGEGFSLWQPDAVQ